ncbi:MAG: AmmeMemoRadiSam system protein A [Clostridiales bacterium]|nr:AmmeMemoRadiSam system protein A [Clostridiales bacterium]
MGILAGFLTPHPPLIINEIGKGDEKKVLSTVEGMKDVSNRISQLSPHTIVIISPHGPLFSDGIAVLYEKELTGNFNKFGEYTLEFNKKNDLELVDELTKIMTKKYKLSGALIDKETAEYFGTSHMLDHGTLVPMYFIDQKYPLYKIVAITYGLLSYQDLYKVGIALKEAIENLDRRAVIIASGDLSHRLKDSGPYDYNPVGKLFDEKIIDLLVRKKNEKIISMDPEFCEEAGECGKRSIDILLGALDGSDYETDMISYEGPFGVGYGIVAFENIQNHGRSMVEKIEKSRADYVERIMNKEDSYVKLAREAINQYILYKGELNFLESEYFNIEELKATRRGVFVSIKDSGGLRGCIGTFLPTRNTLGEEIVENAISAATRDPRFPVVEKEEMDDLTITVDILETPTPVENIEELDPEIYGIIVTSEYKRGLLLPNLKGINTVEDQLNIALKKAGIDKNETYSIEKFTVTRHY